MVESPWLRIASVAQRQYGVVSLAQLREGGLSRRQIQLAATGGRLFPMCWGVFALGHRPSDHRAYWLAAALSCGPGSFLSHRANANLLAILPTRTSRIDVTVTSGERRSRGRIRAHRRDAEPDELVIFQSIPCGNVSRAILDVASSGERHVLERCVKEAGGRGLLNAPQLALLLDRYPGRRGVGLLRDLLGAYEHVPVKTRSELERRMYRLCSKARLPIPLTNDLISTDEGTFELDCVWHEERLIIECDSGWHDNPLSAGDDAAQDQALTHARWRVHRIRWAQVVQAPTRAAETIVLLIDQQRRLRQAG